MFFLGKILTWTAEGGQSNRAWTDCRSRTVTQTVARKFCFRKPTELPVDGGTMADSSAC